MQSLTPQTKENFIEEDEIDLRELFKTIVEGKKIILSITLLIVTVTFFYVLKLPNSYSSSALLIPTEQDKGSALGGLGGLAAMAGVSLGGSSSMTPDVAFESLLNNYDFMREFVEKNKILEHYSRENADENYVFALGYRGIYDLFRSESEAIEDREAALFDLIKTIKTNFSISPDKKSGLITISYSDHDRSFAPKMVNMFLEDASEHLVKNNLNNVNKKLHYFEKEMAHAQGFEMRQSLSGIISKIVQEKVMMQSKQYYQSDLLTPPQEAYIKDKTKPKRGLILVVSFVTSIILGIFVVFFISFLRQNRDEKELEA